MGAAWFVLYTKPFQEVSSAIEITGKLGFPTFYPLHRRKRVHNNRVEEIVGPLFPRYIFAQFDRSQSDWIALKSTKGILCILTDTERKPIPVRNDVIDALRNAPEGEPEETPAAAIYSTNQRVSIVDGPLQGLEGLFKGNASQRTQVLLEIMGRKVKVRLGSIVAA